MIKNSAISFIRFLGLSVVNSYSMLFFSRNRIFATLVLLASFFNPFAGIAGFVATNIAVITAHALGYSKEQVETGLYTYSALLLGLGMGTFFETGVAFWTLLALASLLSVLLSVVLVARFAKNGLPALSLAFIFSLWLVILAAKEFSSIGLTERNIYWLNEMYAAGGSKLIQFAQSIENLRLPGLVAGFFRSLSAIIFQSNIATGILLAVGLLLNSRIAFVLIVLGYGIAMWFNHLMGNFSSTDVNYYNLGTNFMLVAVAIGGFYLIPSVRSFLWALIMVPVSYVLVVGLSKITYTWGLPVFSLPFCIVVILFLYCLRLRTNAGRLVVTPIQYYHPETNLYRYINGKERVLNRYYFPLSLPFMGEWTVSQGYDTKVTHKADWGKAIDFVILDGEMKTYANPGTMREHFYCYNKPILSPADGLVEEVADHVEDNEVGKNNTSQNWGNTIVIKHAEGVYTKLSHLKKNSIKVAKGAYVRRGEIIAACGNSGRSPEPHLHFQVQATPYIGSKTTAYPFAYYTARKNDKPQLENFQVPAEGEFVTNVETNAPLQQAFNFQPGYLLTVGAENFETEEWEVKTSIYNESYFYCKQNNDYAYFINNGTVFYFTNYFGSRKTLLYNFYLASYKVLLSSNKLITVSDTYPLNVSGIHPLKWLQDLLAPFYIFMKIRYESTVTQDDGFFAGGTVTFKSTMARELFKSRRLKMDATVEIENGQINSFTIISDTKTISATCTA